MQAIIQTPTNQLQNSVEYYSQLQFKTISSNNSQAWVTDGKVVIEINADRFARAGVKLYADSWGAVVEKLRNQSAIINIENGFLLSDPSGTWIYLLETKPPISFQQSQESFSVLGKFAGMSLETTEIERAIAIWETLGFKKTMGSMEQGWIAYQYKDELTISIMKPQACPHLFFNPSLTYFNSGQNPAIIAKIREIGIPITEEITHFNDKGEVDNIIIRDPGGLGYFIFND